MKKKVFGRKFSRGTSGRIALFRALVRALVLNGKITTTKARAKAVQGQIDKYVSHAKKGGVSLRRKVLAEMGNDRETVDRLFGKIAPVFAKRESGFSKITLLKRRKGDNAEMVMLEWVDKVQEEDKADKKIKVEKKEKKGKKETKSK